MYLGDENGNQLAHMRINGRGPVATTARTAFALSTSMGLRTTPPTPAAAGSRRLSLSDNTIK